jgi:hypothetical protein
LLNRKRYLASGVVAAFECKLTLTAGHIAQAVQNAAAIRRTLFVRTGTPYRELFSPLIFGLLAHSHTWQAPASAPEDNISRGLARADREITQHPRETLDFLCVADVATWFSWKVLPSVEPPEISLPPKIAALDQTLNTAYVGPMGDPGDRPPPIGSFFQGLLRRVAWEDPSLRRMADYWRWAPGVGGGGGSSDIRAWEADEVLSPETIRERPEHSSSTVDEWNEWAKFFP